MGRDVCDWRSRKTGMERIAVGMRWSGPTGRGAARWSHVCLRYATAVLEPSSSFPGRTVKPESGHSLASNGACLPLRNQAKYSVRSIYEV